MGSCTTGLKLAQTLEIAILTGAVRWGYCSAVHGSNGRSASVGWARSYGASQDSDSRWERKSLTSVKK